MKNNILIKVFVAVFLLFTIVVVTYFVYAYSLSKQFDDNFVTKIFPTITPTPYRFPYKNPVIKKNQSYRIVIIGDSITKALGLNANILRLNLIEYYPNNEFVTYNYGYSSTNIESVPDRLTKTTSTGVNNEEVNQAILSQEFELIILESFGYNPLSGSNLDNGLKKQEEVLTESVNLILTGKPNAALAFMTPIAPDPLTFAKGTLDLSPEQRKSWVAERVSYIKNFQKFADMRGIPVIDIYSKSLNSNGSVNKSYISDDFIHPSNKGIVLMSAEIADYIFKNKIFPE